MTLSLSRPSLDEIAAAVLSAMQPLGHPVAEKYVRSMRSIAVTEAESDSSSGNGAEGDWVYFALAAMSPRERDLACLRDATAAKPRLTLGRLSEELATCGPLRGWAALIAAARQQRLAAFAVALEPLRGSGSPLEALFPAAEELMRIATAAQSQEEPSNQVMAASAIAPSIGAALAPSPVPAAVTAPNPPVVAQAEPLPDPTTRLAQSRPAPARSLAETVADLEATARKTTDRRARASLYHRIGLLHAEQLAAPRSALESHLLAFMLDPLPYEHFVAVEQACRGMDRHKDLVHIYQSAIEALQDGAAYPVSVGELLWRCLQTQQQNLLREADAADTAARLALEASVDEALLRRLLAWTKEQRPADDALIALVSSRLPLP